jgi:hypothetical protein
VFEPNGLQVVTPMDVSIPALLIRHIGSSSTSQVDAGVVQNCLSQPIPSLVSLLWHLSWWWIGGVGGHKYDIFACEG